MFCGKCKSQISECTCDDIDERMAVLNNNPHFIYKKCRTCEKHYQRCKCENPDWTTSHDGVELEDVVKPDKGRDTFISPIFGETREASEAERDSISTFVNNTPVAVFQELNKAMNKVGLCISIAPVEGEPEHGSS